MLGCGLRSPWGLGKLDQFDLIPFGSVHKRDAATVRFQVRTVRVFEPEFGKVLSKFLQTIHRECQMCQVGLDFHRPAPREVAKLDEFLAVGSLHENQFPSTWRLLPMDLFETQDVLIETDGTLQIVKPVARVQELFGCRHGLRILRNCDKAITASKAVSDGSERVSLRLPYPD